MNLTWGTNWQSTVLVQDVILPNTYDATVAFEFNTPVKEKQMVAFDRMKFIFDMILAGNMIANVENPLVGKLYETTNTTINTLPIDPLDEAMAAVIMSKIISVTDNNILIDRIDISSSLGDNITNSVYIDDLEDLDYLRQNAIAVADPNTPAWWFRPEVDVTDIIVLKKKTAKIIHDSQKWEDFGLGWDKEEEVIEPKGPAKIIKMHGWKPKIIKGGKDGTRPMGSTITD